MTKKKASKPKSSPMPKQKHRQRIGHLYHGAKAEELQEDWGSIPRGWIHPDGRFFRTKHHWSAIATHLGIKTRNDTEAGERYAHHAYAKGWISLGHGGVLNAVGHKRTFEALTHPALVTLRTLLSQVPHFSLRIERQMGELDEETGRHEDFDVREYDLDVFIKRGRLRKYA